MCGFSELGWRRWPVLVAYCIYYSDDWPVATEARTTITAPEDNDGGTRFNFNVLINLKCVNIYSLNLLSVRMAVEQIIRVVRYRKNDVYI